jgi:hypothetical protein
MVAAYFKARYAISKEHCPRLVKEEFQLGLSGAMKEPPLIYPSSSSATRVNSPSINSCAIFHI